MRQYAAASVQCARCCLHVLYDSIVCAGEYLDCNGSLKDVRRGDWGDEREGRKGETEGSVSCAACNVVCGRSLFPNSPSLLCNALESSGSSLLRGALLIKKRGYCCGNGLILYAAAGPVAFMRSLWVSLVVKCPFLLFFSFACLSFCFICFYLLASFLFPTFFSLVPFRIYAFRCRVSPEERAVTDRDKVFGIYKGEREARECLSLCKCVSEGNVMGLGSLDEDTVPCCFNSLSFVQFLGAGTEK